MSGGPLGASGSIHSLVSAAFVIILPMFLVVLRRVFFIDYFYLFILFEKKNYFKPGSPFPAASSRSWLLASSSQPHTLSALLDRQRQR